MRYKIKDIKSLYEKLNYITFRKIIFSVKISRQLTGSLQYINKCKLFY